METKQSDDTDLRMRLRNETKASHRRIDSLMEQRPPLASPENYAWYLNGMLQLYEECAQSVQVCEREADLPSREQPLSELIRQDLVALDFKATIEDRDERSQVKPLDSLCTSEHWGRAYVIEGSAMGGKMMARMAAERLGPPASHQYLQQLSSDATSRWPLFVKAINGVELDKEAAIKSACGVFALAYHLFESNVDS